MTGTHSASAVTSRGKILLAEEMGYCWGVRRALDIIQEAGDPADPVATIGDVIHNPQVVERLRARGVETAPSIEEAAKAGYARVAITAHGAGPHMAAEAEKLGRRTSRHHLPARHQGATSGPEVGQAGLHRRGVWRLLSP